ncbi:MAG: fatty acid desaturase [Alphaproteobacteria bacterium]|nr:fatty acid desaturase [Alphaproteobacteria bacterium]MCB9797667.1 fatty acid desaturase [Alphaproteobacteria bacterium]
MKAHRPEPRSLAWALLAYGLIVAAPFALSAGLLWALSAASGRSLPIGALVLATLALRQLNVGVLTTLYHRGMSHRALRFHPRLEWALRLWGWLFIGPGTRTWAIVHRWHHAQADRPGDPHSPSKPGESLATLTRQAIGAFRSVARDEAPARRFAAGLPEDRLEALIRWDERRLFGVYGLRLPAVLCALSALYLALGLPLGWALLAGLATLPATNGAVLSSSVLLIGGVAHLAGYRNFDTPDTSTNLLPVDLLGWGEGLHNNHHARPACADMAAQPWEWDPGFAALALLERLGLVRDLRRR